MNASGPWADPTEGLIEGPHGFGHDADWCRVCNDGCGDAYGGVCDCCAAWSRDLLTADPDAVSDYLYRRSVADGAVDVWTDLGEGRSS